MRLAHGLLVILLFLTACAPATEAQKPPLYVVILNYDRTGHILGFLPEGNTEIDIDETYLIFVDEATFQNFTVGEVVAQDLTVISEGDQRGNIFVPLPPIAASVWIYTVTVFDAFVVDEYTWKSGLGLPTELLNVFNGIYPWDPQNSTHQVYAPGYGDTLTFTH